MTVRRLVDLLLMQDLNSEVKLTSHGNEFQPINMIYAENLGEGFRRDEDGNGGPATWPAKHDTILIATGSVYGHGCKTIYDAKSSRKKEKF